MSLKQYLIFELPDFLISRKLLEKLLLNILMGTIMRDNLINVTET